jgi:uncharacterized membrane-anchored protein
MKSKRINIPIYDFRLDLLEVENSNDVALLARFFKSVRLDEDITLEILNAIKDGDVDGGWTISNFGHKRILVVLLKMRSEEKRREVLAHEKRHVEDDILEHASVNDKEAAGYLAGYLGKFMY